MGTIDAAPRMGGDVGVGGNEARRLCLATDSRAPSGLGAHLLTLARGCAAAGWDVTVMARAETGLLARAAVDGHAIARLSDDDGVNARLLARGRFALVHVHAGIGWEGHALIAAARRSGAGVVRTEHLPWLLTADGDIAAYRAMVGGVDALIGVSQTVADGFAAAVPGVPVHAVANGIEPPPRPAVPRDAMRRRLGIDRRGAAPPLLLHIGRLAPQKRHPLLLDAMAALRAKGTGPAAQARLLLVGDGPDAVAIARAIADKGLADRVRMLGQRDDIACLMAAADALVLPSAFEGLPLVLLEAMAAGLPVIATDAPGIRDAIDAETGWLVPAAAGRSEADEADALADVIAAALADPDAGRARAAAAAARQADRFTAARMTHDTLAILDAYRKDPAPMTRTRIAFVGAGGIAHRHLGVLEQMDDVAVVGVIDPDAARAEEAAARVGARAFTGDDVAAMIAAVRPDALFICVPPFAHGAAERAALAADLPFFVEKPVGLDMEAVDAIAAEVAAKGLVTAVGYHWRYLDTLDDVRHAIGDRRPRLASGYWLDSTPPPQWWWRRDQSGGQLVEQTTHLIDLARVLMGDVTRVYGMAETSHRDSYPGLDIATASTASLQFADGAMANFASTCLLGWNHRVGLHLFGDRFAVELTDHDVMIDVGHGRPVTGNRSDPVWREDRDFIDAVHGKDNRIRCPYAEAAETLRVVLAIERSVTEGRAIDIAPASHRITEDAA